MAQGGQSIMGTGWWREEVLRRKINNGGHLYSRTTSGWESWRGRCKVNAMIVGEESGVSSEQEHPEKFKQQS